MLFFACCWPCSSYVDSSDRLARVIRACCLLSRNGFAVRLLRLYLWAVLQVAMPTLCFSCATGCSLLPARVIHVIQVTIVLRHRAVLDNLTLPLPVFFSITGSSGCDSFSVLSSSDVASCERRVPRAPLCASLRQCDSQSGTSNATTRSAPLRDRWFAVGTLASLCGSLQQRGPLSLRKFSLSGLGAILPRCGLGPATEESLWSSEQSASWEESVSVVAPRASSKLQRQLSSSTSSASPSSSSSSSAEVCAVSASVHNLLCGFLRILDVLLLSLVASQCHDLFHDSFRNTFLRDHLHCFNCLLLATCPCRNLLCDSFRNTLLCDAANNFHDLDHLIHFFVRNLLTLASATRCGSRVDDRMKIERTSNM